MDSFDMQSFDSPKRKRWPPAVSTIPPTPPTSSPPPERRLHITVPKLAVTDDLEPPGSPRTKVAYNFKGLQLEERAEVTQFKLDMPRLSAAVSRQLIDIEDPHPEEEVVRKRVKLLKERKDYRTEIPETPDIRKAKIKEATFAFTIGPAEEQVDPVNPMTADAGTLTNLVDHGMFKGDSIPRFKGMGNLARAYPSINRLGDSKSRSKKRCSTPPGPSSVDTMDQDEEEHKIVDPERASLTWHDDEITGHDPDDPDDDGEGINGIGFKPTSAEAYTRSQKRRQQMAEYKNREAREARKNRIERRRATDKDAMEKESEKARRVRFTEAEPDSIMSI
jgi:hypothetical protein